MVTGFQSTLTNSSLIEVGFLDRGYKRLKRTRLCKNNFTKKKKNYLPRFSEISPHPGHSFHRYSVFRTDRRWIRIVTFQPRWIYQIWGVVGVRRSWNTRINITGYSGTCTPLLEYSLIQTDSPLTPLKDYSRRTLAEKIKHNSKLILDGHVRANNISNSLFN